MNIRQMQKLQTKEKILEKAYFLYGKDGFNISTDKIAELSEVSHGTVFSHFPRKEDLIIEVIQRFDDILTNKLHQLSVNTSSIEHALNEYIDIIIQYEDFYTSFIREKDYLPKEARIIYISMNSGASHHFMKILNQNQVIAVEPSFIFNTWQAIIHYYLLNKDLFAPEDSVLEKYKEKIINSFLIMIKKEDMK